MYYMCVIHGTPSVPPLCFVYLIFKENQPAELKKMQEKQQWTHFNITNIDNITQPTISHIAV